MMIRKIEEGIKGAKIKKEEVAVEEPVKVDDEKEEKTVLPSRNKAVAKPKKIAKVKTKVTKEKK